MATKDTTELHILEAAKRLFFEHGFAGTSTTDIAREAGVNQALVHYYYRTKENLFRQIFIEQARNIFDMIKQTFENDLPFEDMIRHCVSVYFDLLAANPQLPYFVLNELINNPARRTFIREHFLQDPNYAEVYTRFTEKVRGEIAAGRMVDIQPLDIMLNLVSLTVFSFISLPLYKDLLARTEADCTAYLAHRKEEVIRLLLRGIRI